MARGSKTSRAVTMTVRRTVQQVQKPCPVCQTAFWGSPLRTYCSVACKSKANYERHSGAYRKARREKYAKEKNPAHRP